MNGGIHFSNFSPLSLSTTLPHIQHKNAAYKFNKDIVIGEYPDFEIDYAKVKISEGSLALPEDFELQINNQNLTFKLKTLPSNYPDKKIDDLLAYAVLCKDNKIDISASTYAAQRGAGRYEFTLPENFYGREIHVYATFLSNKRENACNSAYFGAYNIPVP